MRASTGHAGYGKRGGPVARGSLQDTLDDRPGFAAHWIGKALAQRLGSKPLAPSRAGMEHHGIVSPRNAVDSPGPARYSPDR
jgi:hypothetical protein